MEDLGRRARGVGVDAGELGPAVAPPELVDEADPPGVGKGEEAPEVARGAAEHRAGPGGHDGALEGGDVGELAEVPALPSQHPIEGERHGLALDDGLASERLVPLAGRPDQEAVEVDL